VRRADKFSRIKYGDVFILLFAELKLGKTPAGREITPRGKIIAAESIKYRENCDFLDTKTFIENPGANSSLLYKAEKLAKRAQKIQIIFYRWFSESFKYKKK